MKKIYLFIAVALFAATISASAQKVTLRLSNNYEVNIDGRYYDYNSTVPTLNYGMHTVKLYEVQPGFLGIGKKRNLVSTSSFELRNNDIVIETDQYGRLRINEVGNYDTQNQNRNRNINGNGDYGYQQRTQNNQGNGYGPYNNPGRGHKYGLYKHGYDKQNRSNGNTQGNGKNRGNERNRGNENDD